jgi:hypothetical protein
MKTKDKLDKTNDDVGNRQFDICHVVYGRHFRSFDFKNDKTINLILNA